MLPAEGAIFLTNYRIIFKGSPIDPFSSEHTITRAFPVTSITREKKFSLNEYLSEIDQTLKEGLQVRSNTLQLIRVAFDDEVSVEDINKFRANIHNNVPVTAEPTQLKKKKPKSLKKMINIIKLDSYFVIILLHNNTFI